MLITYYIAVHYIYHIYINQYHINIMFIILVKNELFLDNFNKYFFANQSKSFTIGKKQIYIMNSYLNLINRKVCIFIMAIGLNTVTHAEVEFPTSTHNQIVDNILSDYKVNNLDQHDIGYKWLNLFDGTPNYLPTKPNNYSMFNLNIDKQNLEQTQQTVIQYITTKYKNVSRQDAYHITKSAFEHARNNNIDPTLLLGLIEKESSFQKHITSKLNAQGLMQVIPRWHKATITRVVNKNGGDIKSIHNNIEIGTFILKTNLQKYHSIPRALQAYNGSHNGTSYSRQVLNFQNNIKRAIEVKTIAL